MNKLQYIELLKLRGITKLERMTLGTALTISGGEATEIEMIIVNRNILNNERRKKLNKINESR
jgi:glutamine amidotransferase PdxT